MSRNVLIFSLTYFPFVGGAEVAVKEIADRIGGVSFDLVTARLDRNLPARERIGRINVFRVGRGWKLDKYLYPWLAYAAAKKLHREKKYDVVQAIMAFYAGLAALFFKCTYPQVKYLLTMQSGDSKWFVWLRTWFWYPVYRCIYTKPDYIQAISCFLGQRARRYGYEGDIEIVPNGVNVDVFQRAGQEEIQQVRDSLHVCGGEKVIVTVSRLVKKNGVGDLIKAARYLDFPYKLLIIGLGKDEKKFKQLVRKNALENRILFLGYIGHDELSQYLSAADIFVRPSLSEGFGNVFAEALACGTPIVGTNTGGSSALIFQGLCCEPSDPQDIARKVTKMLFAEDAAGRVEIGQTILKQEYTWDILGRRMEAIYQKLC